MFDQPPRPANDDERPDGKIVALEDLRPDARFLVATLRVWFAPNVKYSQRRRMIEDGFAAVGARGAAAPMIRFAGWLAFSGGRPCAIGHVGERRLTADERWIASAFRCACGAFASDLACGLCQRFGGAPQAPTDDLIELKARFTRAGLPERRH